MTLQPAPMSTERVIANPAASAANEKLPIGYILSLEGADSILSFKHLERSYEQGLRALGPAHYGPGLYAQGTGETGKFPARGKELLRSLEGKLSQEQLEHSKKRAAELNEHSNEQFRASLQP